MDTLRVDIVRKMWKTLPHSGRFTVRLDNGIRGSDAMGWLVTYPLMWCFVSSITLQFCRITRSN